MDRGQEECQKPFVGCVSKMVFGKISSEELHTEQL